MTDTPAHYRFLADSDYESIAAWAHDSDYALGDDGEWYQTDNPSNPVSIMDCLYDAIDACGWEDPGEPVDKASFMNLHIKFHNAAEREAFERALTGHDNDVLLAAERAINARLGIDAAIMESRGVWLLLGSRPE